MKINKMKKIALLMICLMVGMVALAGCGDKYADSPYVGKWTATSASMSGISISPDSVLGGEMSFDLKASGKCTLIIAGDETNGKWEETDNGFTVEDEMEFVVDGSSATLDYSGVTFIFEKQ